MIDVWLTVLIAIEVWFIMAALTCLVALAILLNEE